MRRGYRYNNTIQFAIYSGNTANFAPGQNFVQGALQKGDELLQGAGDMLAKPFQYLANKRGQHFTTQAADNQKNINHIAGKLSSPSNKTAKNYTQLDNETGQYVLNKAHDNRLKKLESMPNNQQGVDAFKAKNAELYSDVDAYNAGKQAFDNNTQMGKNWADRERFLRENKWLKRGLGATGIGAVGLGGLAASNAVLNGGNNQVQPVYRPY